MGCGGCGIVYEVELIRGARAGLRAAMKAETIDASHKYSETLSAEVKAPLKFRQLIDLSNERKLFDGRRFCH